MTDVATRTGADRTLALLEGQVGRSLAEVETPVAVIDLDRLEANLTDLQSYADAHGIALWPHTKTHKAPEIGLRQLELGAAGLTVAKTGEAQVFQEAGAPRILVHYPPFGADKWERLADIAATGVELTVAVDSVAPAEGLARVLDRRGLTAELLVELDVGLHRTGQTTVPGAVAIAEQLAKLPPWTWPASAATRGTAGAATRLPEKLAAVDELLRETRDAFAARGLALRPHLGRLDTDPPPDTHDVRERASLGDVCAPRPQRGRDDRCALWVEVTVVSDAVSGQVVVDGGSKTFTSDPHPDGGHGSVVGRAGAHFARINEEHGYVDVSALDERPAVGERLQIVPNHACGCMNLHDGVLAVRDGVVDHVIRVSGRGLIR